MSEMIEEGEIYFFYRNKIGVDRASSRDDVQRFYLAMVPDGRQDRSRLFTVGKKRLPSIDATQSTGREWLMATLVGRPHELAEALEPIEYETKTRGTRRISEAFPAGAGRYALFEHEDHTELAYRLTEPEEMGPPQKALELRPEAGYVISVRNPSLQVEGFPEAEPGYPQRLAKLFAEERWIGVRDPELLEYETTQLVLIGARESLEDLDLEIRGFPDLFETLGLDEEAWPTEALYDGRFARARGDLEARPPDADPSKGGRRGGRRARRSTSAAGIARALTGVDLPRDKDELIDYAEDHDADGEVIETLRTIPDRRFETMVDVQRAVGEVR